MRSGEQYKACANKLCLRKVGVGNQHCCRPCILADGHYEIHEDGPLAHTESCDLRAAERGEWTQIEAEGRRWR